ncbi:MAG: 30S ribosomal protein S2 [Proteobacteria bacterium]|nr:30S ribosomal protein S2 [Pseudomonadota bacterium]
MTETTVDPSVSSDTAPPAAPETAEALERSELNVRTLLEAGVHFGHQTRRWDPQMKPFIFGDRNGIHIVDLDQTLPLFQQALEFVRETTSRGGKVLFVSTKRQAAVWVQSEAVRSNQYYVNNRWLGGMLTNFKTVKKSIERYKELIELLDNEEKAGELSKKERSRLNRQREKYFKSLDGIREMTRLPDAVFVIDVAKEHIAVTEARRLGIPVVAVVDTNCSPLGVDYVVPGNDDAIRAIQLYCQRVADACLEGDALHQDKLQADRGDEPRPEPGDGATTGRRVVEIKQQPRRGRGHGGGSGSGRTHSSGGRDEGEAAPAASAAPAESGASDN